MTAPQDPLDRVKAIFDHSRDDIPSLPEFDATLRALGNHLARTRRRNWFHRTDDDSFVDTVRDPDTGKLKEKRLWPLGDDVRLYIDGRGNLAWYGVRGDLERTTSAELSNSHRRRAIRAARRLLPHQ